MRNFKKITAVIGCAIILSVGSVTTLTLPSNTPIVSLAATTNVSSYDELVSAVAKGGTIKITQHIYMEKPITISKSITFTRDTNTSYNICTKNSLSSMFTIEKNATVTLSNGIGIKGGNGTTATVTSTVIKINEGGKLIIEDGNVMYSKGRLISNYGGSINFKAGAIYNSLGVPSNYGGAIHMNNSSTMIMSGGTIKENAYGGIYVGGGCSFTMSGGSISSNQMGAGNPTGDNHYGCGGAIYNNGTVKMTGGNITNNVGKNDGGAIYNNGTLTLSGGLIKANSTSGFGGAIYNNGTTNISAGIISDNTSEYGGGIYNSSNVSISGGSFSANLAKINGGAVYSAGKLTMSGGSMTLNNAKSNGGAICAKNTFTMSGGSISSNSCASANQGAGVYLCEDGLLKLSGDATIAGASGSSAVNDILLQKDGMLYIENIPKSKLLITPGTYTNGFTLAKSSKLAASTYLNYISLSTKPGWYLKSTGNNVICSEKFTFSVHDTVDINKIEKNIADNLYYQDIYTIPAWSKTGYTFLGYNTKQDGSGTSYTPGQNVKITQNVYIYALWKENEYTLKYDANGGNNAPDTITFLYTKWLNGVDLSNNYPARTGYTFLGWNTKEDGSGTSYQPGSTVKEISENTILYAQWAENKYKIIYNSNAGGAVNNMPKTANIPYTNLYEGVNVDSLKPTRTGYTFLGWNTKENGSGTSYQPGDNIKGGTEDIILFAQWKEDSYNITYNANGGTDAPAATNALYTNWCGGLEISSAKPVRAGYTFLNWNTKPDGSGTIYGSGDVLQITSNITLYAQWASTYTVTYNANGGTNAPAATKALSTEWAKGCSISSAKPNKTGFTFVNWNTKPDGSGTIYGSGDVLRLTKNITLYARWVETNTSNNTNNTNVNNAGTVKVTLRCSNSKIKLNTSNSNSYGIKSRKKVIFKVNAVFSNANPANVKLYYQFVGKGSDYNTKAWKFTNGNIKVSKSRSACRLYIKAVYGNRVAIVKTKGFVVDLEAPTITGVRNNKTYKKTVTIRAYDDISGIKYIKLNNRTIKSGKKITKKGNYKIVTMDKCGNKRTIKFKIKK